MADLIGKQYGNFRLVKLIGRGGFADVYLAQHLMIPTIQMAVKILNASIPRNEQASFIDEARTLAQCNHPHIVKIVDFNIDPTDASPFLVMEYAGHGTLPNRTVLPLSHIQRILFQIASALQYAHDRNIIHRDLKPSNVLVRLTNDVVLSDFGIAAVASSTRSHVTTNFSGTISYSAPEQILGKVRKESDQYALGIMLYEWISGGVPFKGTPNEIMMQHLQGPVPSLKDHVPSIPSVVEAVVLKALEKDPNQRFANVRELSEAFSSACAVTYSRPPNSEQLAPTVLSNTVQLKTTLPPVKKVEMITPVQPWSTPVKERPTSRAQTNDQLASKSQQILDRKPKVVSKVVSQNPPKNNFWYLLGNGLIIGGAAIWIVTAILTAIASRELTYLLGSLSSPFFTYSASFEGLENILVVIFACLVGFIGSYGMLKNSHRMVTQWGTILISIILIVYSFLPIDATLIIWVIIKWLDMFASFVYLLMISIVMVLHKQENRSKQIRILSCVGSIPITCFVLVWWGVGLWLTVIGQYWIQGNIMEGGIVIMFVGVFIQFIASFA